MKKITDENFKETMLQSKDIVVVFCSAVWCQPCKKQKPISEAFEEAKQEEVTCLSLDVDEASDVAIIYDVNSIPAYLWFDKGVLVNKEFGLKKMSALEESLAKVKESATL